jgi:hypothetical protein
MHNLIFKITIYYPNFLKDQPIKAPIIAPIAADKTASVKT